MNAGDIVSGVLMIFLKISFCFIPNPGLMICQERLDLISIAWGFHFI